MKAALKLPRKIMRPLTSCSGAGQRDTVGPLWIPAMVNFCSPSHHRSSLLPRRLKVAYDSVGEMNLDKPWWRGCDEPTEDERKIMLDDEVRSTGGAAGLIVVTPGEPLDMMMTVAANRSGTIAPSHPGLLGRSSGNGTSASLARGFRPRWSAHAHY